MMATDESQLLASLLLEIRCRVFKELLCVRHIITARGPDAILQETVTPVAYDNMTLYTDPESFIFEHCPGREIPLDPFH